MFRGIRIKFLGPVVKRFIAAMLVSALAANALAAPGADESFEVLAERFVSDLPTFSPVGSTWIGDHSADSQLDEVDADARDALKAAYREYLGALADIDRDALSRANQVDFELLSAEIRSRLWSLETLQEWAWNPLYFVNRAGSSIYNLVARDFAPVEDRLGNAAIRLEQFPRFLEQARASIEPERVPKIHAETAVAQNLGVVSIIETMIIPEMGGLTEATRTRLEAAIETAKDALADHQTWLEEELLPRATGDFRIGADLFDKKLAFTLDSPMNRKEVQARAEAEYESLRNQMYEVSKEVYLGKHPYTAFPDNPDESYKQTIIRAALEEAYKVLPPRDGIVDVAKSQLQQAIDFVIENNIVTMPDDPVEIIIMPEFQRGVSVAYLDSPGPLDKGLNTYYAVAPLPDDWTEAQVESFLREYNELSIQVLTVHEGVPGHYLQLALSNRYPSTLRGILGSGPMIEGWAEYAERVMIDAGYLDNDPLARLIFMKWYLRGVTNAIIDAAIHVDGMTRDEAMKLMIEGGFQEEREAAGKWVRAQLSSTQLSTYFVGYQEWVELRKAVEEAWGGEFTLRRYHDQVLSYGSPPVKYIRALTLGEGIPRGGE
jgi:uncharacterized protein (DUF885 family)